MEGGEIEQQQQQQQQEQEKQQDSNPPRSSTATPTSTSTSTPAVEVSAQNEKEGEGDNDGRVPLSTDSMVSVPLSAGLSSDGHAPTPDRRESSVPEEWLSAEKPESTDSVMHQKEDEKDSKNLDGEKKEEEQESMEEEHAEKQQEKGQEHEREQVQEKIDRADDEKPICSAPIVESPRESIASPAAVNDQRRSSVDMFAPDDEQPGSKGSSVTGSRPSSCTSTNSRRSDGGENTPDTDNLDWVELEKTEEQESKADPDDEATALLLARLDQENNALVTNPKSGLSNGTTPRTRPKSRPPSIQRIKQLVDEPDQPSSPSVRVSQLPAPQMTELEFWAALVADYPRTAQKLPTLTSNKIRGGVPPPLRGVVWPSIAGARDTALQEEFGRLCDESSPYEGMIGKDIGRSWPNVDMFKDPNGEGQQMLARVLKCFSLYDTKIGYCQGLGFVVGPLLMQMSEAEAFCVLVRLMDHYDLRSCFQPALSGLHLRIYQFQTLLSKHLPKLHGHLEELKIEPVYLSQWFLSFFAVTCPLPMLLRIYDVLLLEGACETLMRVALSLMQRNEQKLLECHEIEDVMQLLLSRSLWDTYACNADDLVADFVSLTSLVTRESLQSIEAGYKNSTEPSAGINFPQMQAVASRFLGRLWASSSSTYTKSVTTAPPPQSGTPSSVTGTIRRTPSKQSMASTLNSLESTSDTSTLATEVSSQDSKRKLKQQNKDSNLHSQIEDLLVALTDMQREQAALAKELQKEREEREEDQKLAALLVGYIKEQGDDDEAGELLSKAAGRFSSRSSKRLSSLQTKQQLREDVTTWKEKYEIETARCQNLGRRIDEHEQQQTQLKEELEESRNQLRESQGENRQLEQTIQELRASPSSASTTGSETASSPSSDLKLDKSSPETSPSSTSTTTPATTAAAYSKRTSSLGAPTVISTANYEKADEDSLLVELVNSKTAEAVARQELEEVKVKFEAMTKTLSQTNTTAAASSSSSSASASASPSSESAAGANAAASQPTASSTSTTSAGSALSSAGTFFSSWTRRKPSTATVVEGK